MRLDEAQRQKRRRVLLALMLFAGMALAYLVFNVSQFERLENINALDYAQIARHVLRGDGFQTSFIKPLGLVYERSIENHPDLTYPPIHILWTSVVMRLLGATDRAVSHASGFAFLLTLPLIFFVALRMFDWRTAVLASVVFGVHVANLQYAVSGLETSLLALLFTGLLFALYEAGGGTRYELAWVAGAGALMGLIYLTKYVWIVTAIPIIVYLVTMKPGRRLARVALFVGVVVVVAAPWLWRNYAITGNPFFTLRTHELVSLTRAHPANTMYRTFPDHVPGYVVFVAENPRAIFMKVRGGVGALLAVFHDLAGRFVTPFFVVAVMVRLGEPRFERLRYVVYAVFLLLCVSLAFVIADPRLVAPVSPIVTIVAVAFFWRLLDARVQALDERSCARWTALAVAVLLVLHAYPFVTVITPDEPEGVLGETPIETAMMQVKSLVDGPVLTDSPWTVAWMAEKDAVWLPMTETDFRRMEDAVGRFEWLLLGPSVARMAAPERMQEWAGVWLRAQRGDAEYLGFVISARLGDGRWVLMRRQSGN